MYNLAGKLTLCLTYAIYFSTLDAYLSSLVIIYYVDLCIPALYWSLACSVTHVSLRLVVVARQHCQMKQYLDNYSLLFALLCHNLCISQSISHSCIPLMSVIYFD